MKFLISLLIGITGSIVVILFDIKLVIWIFSLVPQTEWTEIIKVLIVFVDIWTTAGICLIPIWLGIAIGTVLSEISK